MSFRKWNKKDSSIQIIQDAYNFIKDNVHIQLAESLKKEHSFESEIRDMVSSQLNNIEELKISDIGDIYGL